MKYFRILRHIFFCLLLMGFYACRERAQGDSDLSESSESLFDQAFDPADELLGLHEQWTGDLDGMIDRGRIRALVPYNRTYYYIDGPHRR